MERRVKARKAWRPSGSAQTVSAAVAAAAGGGLEVGWRWGDLFLRWAELFEVGYMFSTLI